MLITLHTKQGAHHVAMNKGVVKIFDVNGNEVKSKRDLYRLRPYVLSAAEALLKILKEEK